MIYELQSLSRFPVPDIFAYLPPHKLGLLIWVMCTILSLVYAFRTRSSQASKLWGIPLPLLLASAVYAGVFISTHTFFDELAINLEHSYNLYHYGRFSMSSDRMADGTVEFIYYLVHAPFAWSQHSVVVANYVISFLVGLLHLPLIPRILPKTTPANTTLQLCGFALCAPLVSVFSSGFGNGLVSLLFLTAICAAVNGKEPQSLALSGLLPLLRPDAVLLSGANMLVITIRRYIDREAIFALRRDIGPMVAPLLSAAAYYSFYRFAFGNWAPTPVKFKALTIPMLAMTDKGKVARELGQYFSTPAHAIGFFFVVFLIGLWIRERAWSHAVAGKQCLVLLLYTLATLPLLLFYSVTHATVGDFSFITYPRYWVGFELAFELFILAALSDLQLDWRAGRKRAPSENIALVAFIGVTIPVGILSTSFYFSERIDSEFAGAFTQRYLPPGLSVSTSEMNTFGFMIERPVIDLWGYSTPEIAASTTCNGDRIRNNSRFFLIAKPDIYWPYWFTAGLQSADKIPTFDNMEASLAGSQHLSKWGNLLGDMTEVLKLYDLVAMKINGNQVVYLVRKGVRDTLIGSLLNQGFTLSRQRAFDMAAFGLLYDSQISVSYPCGI